MTSLPNDPADFADTARTANTADTADAAEPAGEAPPFEAAPPAGLVESSIRLGSNLLLVQGAGGNTSETRPGSEGREVMWIKASGMWLSEAAERPCFVAVDAARARAVLGRGEERVPKDAVIGGPRDLRPSIETSLHLGLPQPCVAHVHAVSTIAWAIRTDALARLEERLAGLGWAYVPYARPGLPLAEALDRAVSSGGSAPPPQVVVLERHGLVVAGEDWPEVEAVLAEVEARLALEPRRPAQTSAEERPPAPEGWCWLASKALDALALDPVGRVWAGAGSYYPDHVVFLGHAAHVAPLASLAGADRERSKLAIVPDLGVLIAESVGRGAREMAEALAEVLMRVPPDAELSPLSPEEEASVLGMEAEAYRQRLAARPSS